MSEVIAWIAAESEQGKSPVPPSALRPTSEADTATPVRRGVPPQSLPLHKFPATPFREDRGSAVQPSNNEILPNVESTQPCASEPTPSEWHTPAERAACAAGGDWADDPLYKETDIEREIFEQQRRRRVYRGRTAAMLHRYMRYALETGRIPSILGGDIFRSRVTSYGVSTFEDRAIFVHDMEKCLNRLDELSRQVIARVVLQGHNHNEAARVFGCTRKTIHRNLMEALDRMADILLEVRLLEALPVEAAREKTSPAGTESGSVEKGCQGGEAADFLLSDCEDGK